MIMERVKTDDAIPYWDYDAPVTEETPRDASAAAVTAAGFIELSTMVPNGKKYLDYAEKIREKISAFNGHVIVSNFDDNQSQVTTEPIDTRLLSISQLKKNSFITHVQPVITKEVAHALLAKVYATKPNPDYNKVIQHVDQLSGDYSLLPDYNQLFDGNHNANVESILEINSDASNIWWWGTGMFIGDGWQRFNLPTHDLVNAFDAQNDNIRKTNSIKFDIGVSDAYWTDKNNYPFAYKQRIQDGTQHIYILRYADLLLLKAEAKVKLGDFTGAAALVNQVRGRVSLNPITITSETDGINKILKERLLELAFEGQRWFDLKRTGKALEVIKARTDGKGNKLGYVNNLTEQRLLWPVPQSQLDKNPNLTQNPGY
jgi:hypothetical protein